MTGKQIWMYGGDEGRYPASDHNFNCNGIIAPDRSWNPHAWEVRHWYQDFWVKKLTLNPGSVDIYNERFFSGAEGLRLVIEAQANGKVLAIETVDRLQLPAQQVTSVSFDGAALREAVERNADKEVCINVRLVTARPVGLLDAGYAVSEEQISCSPYRYPVLSELTGAEGAAVEVDSMVACYTLSAAGVSVTVNRRTGHLDYFDVDGRPMLEDGYAVTPNFWRAPTDNDYGAHLQRDFRAWRSPRTHVERVVVEDCGASRSIRVVSALEHMNARTEVVYTLTPKGELVVTEQLDVDENAERKPQMFRFGMQWVMPKAFDRVSYYGRGPIETYTDRKECMPLSLNEAKVSDEYFGYIRPQESGNHCDVRSWAVVDVAGRGLEFTPVVAKAGDEAPMECSSLHFLPSDLDDGNDKGDFQHHSGDLVERPFTVTQVQQQQFGLGCVNSWGAWPLEQYQMPWKDRTFTYRVKALR